MLFGTQAKLRRRDDNLHVMIRNNVIDNVTQFKYLDVWLDPSLTWNMHIDKPVTNVNKRLGVLRIVRSVLPRHTLNMLYKTMLLPHFVYCDTVWGDSSKLCLDRGGLLLQYILCLSLVLLCVLSSIIIVYSGSIQWMEQAGHQPERWRM